MTFGTPVVPDSFLPFNDNTMDVDPGLFSPAVMTGTRDLQVYALYGQEKDAGAIGAPLFPTNGIELLVYAIGSDTVTGASPGPYCVDEATEILTADGWKTVHDLKVGDEVLTYNHETGMSEWQPALEVCVFPAEPREMIRMKGYSHSSLSTPNHRWPVLTQRGHRRWKTTETLAHGERIPKAAMCADLPTEAKYTDAFVEAVTWLWTEGTLRNRREHGETGGALICQSVKNQSNVDRIDASLRQVFGPPGESGTIRGETPMWRRYNEERPDTGDGEDATIVRFVLNKAAEEVLTAIAPDLIVTHAFIRSLTQAQLDLFIKVAMLADNAGPTRLAQKYHGMADAFQFAATLAGHATSFRQRARTGMWEVILHRSKWFVPTVAAKAPQARMKIERVRHDGIVWCPRTPNMTWYARKDGTCYFTGNTHTILQTNTLPSVTVEKNLGNFQSIQFAGTRVSKVSIKGAATDTEAQVTYDLIAQSWAVLNSPSAVVLVNENPFVFAEFTLTWNGNTVAEAGNFTIDIDNGVKPAYTFNGSHEAQFITPEHIHVSGSFDVVWDSLTDSQRGYFNQAVSLETQAQLSFTLVHPASGGSVTFTCPKVNLGKPATDPKMSETIMQTIPFEAYKNVGGSPATTIQAVILNSRSTVY